MTVCKFQVNIEEIFSVCFTLPTFTQISAAFWDDTNKIPTKISQTTLKSKALGSYMKRLIILSFHWFNWFEVIAHWAVK